MFLRASSGRPVVDVIPFFDDGWYHLFYLSPIDVDQRARCTWEHVRSRDLVRWEALPTALHPEPGYIDQDATWTGSVVRVGDRYHLYYTALDTSDPRQQQRIALAVSDDLISFEKVRDFRFPIPAGEHWDTDNFRDPFVTREDDGYRMLISTRWRDQEDGRSGFIAVSHSADGLGWSEPEVYYDGCDTFCPECVDVRRLASTSVLSYSTFTDRKRTVFRARETGDEAWQVPGNAEPDGAWWYASKSLTDQAGAVVSFGWVSDGLTQHGASYHFGGDLALPRQLWLPQRGVLGWRIPDAVRAEFANPVAVTLSVDDHEIGDVTTTIDGLRSTSRLAIVPEWTPAASLTTIELHLDHRGSFALAIAGDTGVRLTLDAARGLATLNPARAADRGLDFDEAVAIHRFAPSGPVTLEIVRRGPVVEICLDRRSWFTARIVPADPWLAGTISGTKATIAVTMCAAADPEEYCP